MLTRRRRRSGVSSVIGAIFFVLVVFLVFSATILVFESFGNYSLLFKGVDQQDAQNRVTDVAVSNLAFGALVIPTPPTAIQTLAAVANTASPTRSLLPISNMNFSSGMSGWVFSRDYKIVRDDGNVSNTYEHVLPGETVFTLSVANTDASGTCAAGTSCIYKVTIQVDSRFAIPICPGSPLCPTPPPGWSVTTAGNTFIWSTPQANGISAGTPPVFFQWAALVAGVPGPYFSTVSLTWLTIFNGVPITDPGFVTVETDVVTSGPGEVSVPPFCPAPATWNICAEPQSVVPGGAVGGYDPISNQVGSESGPGSVYLDFQPTYNGAALVTGQELTAEMNFTSAFTIDPGQASALTTVGAVDALNFGFSLDQVRAPPNPLILINQYLVQIDPITGGTLDVIQIPNTIPVVPTGVNNFNASGWITCGPNSTNCPSNLVHTEPYFNPSALDLTQNGHPWNWMASTLYELEITTTVSMPGVNPPNADYPTSLLMHFDDIGLSLQDTNLAFFSDNAAAPMTIAFVPPVTPSQVQSLQLTTNLALSSTPAENVTAYVFVQDISRGIGSKVWVEVGQLELSSSATISVNIPAASASNFLDPTGTTCGVTGICVRVYAISDGTINYQSLSVSTTVVVQTYQQNIVSLVVLNNSTFPVGFTNAYISGPDGVSSYLLVPNTIGPYYCSSSPPLPTPAVAPSPCYVNQGQQLILQLPFGWRTDQTYTATIVTNKGLSFTATMVSP